MPRWTTRQWPPSRSMTMNLPRRRTARIRRPASASLIPPGSPRNMRRQVNSAETMRRPTMRAMDRATVSTSGSSGTLRHVEQDIVAFHLDSEGRDFLVGIEIVGAGLAVPLPAVPWAHHVVAVESALPQRTAAMQAGAAKGGHASADVAESIQIVADGDFGDRTGR